MVHCRYNRSCVLCSEVKLLLHAYSNEANLNDLICTENYLYKVLEHMYSFSNVVVTMM